MCKRYMDGLPFARPQLVTCPVTQACALTGNRTGNLSILRPALNPLSHTSQGNFQSFFVLSSQIQTRNIRHLPDILVINCEVNSSKEADFWRMQAEVRTGAGSRILGVFLSFSFFKILFIYFLEKGREGEREGEKHQMCGCLTYTPHRGPGPQPRHVP